MATGSISQIKLPNGSTYDLKDANLRQQVGVLSSDGVNIAGVSENYFRPTVKVFDADPVHTDLSVIKLSADDYYELVANDAALSNVIYVVDDDKINVFGEQIKNLAPGTDLSDAVNLEQLSSSIPLSVSQLINDAGYLTAHQSLSNYYARGETSSSVEIQTAFEISSGNKIFIDDRILSSSGYSDLSVIRLSANDYNELVANDAALSNVIYVVDDDKINAFGEQIKNLVPGTDLSDAVNLQQLTEVSARAYDTYTQSEVDQKIASAQYFKKYVVQTLPPVADADERGIYLVPSSDPETQNTYDEYVVVGEGSSKAWEKIGAKNIDLSGYKTKQLSVDSPTASDSATAFIDTISQDENGVITATKKNVQSASTTLAGIVQLNNTLTSTATNQAATANVVKTTYDLASSKSSVTIVDWEED